MEDIELMEEGAGWGELGREVNKSQGGWGPLKRLLLSLQVSDW